MMLNNLKIYTRLWTACLFFVCGQCLAQSPSWTKPKASDYSYSATAICAIDIDDLRSNHPNDRIAFFVGSELRGLGTPVHIGSGMYRHFVTFYANVGMEVMDIKIYHHASDLVYDAINDITFQVQSQLGTLDDPFVGYGYTAYDAPISITDISPVTTLQGTTYDTIELSSFLIQPDTNQVTWSYTPNGNLGVLLDGSKLIVTPNANFFGTTFLIVKATEVSANQHEAEKIITFNVIEAHTPPLLYGIFNQGITLGQSFVDFDLDDFENQYDGPCLEYDYEPVMLPFGSVDTMPAWSISGFPQNNMTLTFSSRFTPKHTFNHTDDKMAIFIGGILRAVSYPSVHEGNPLYFLTIGGSNVENEKIEVRFYSGILQKVFTVLTDFNYIPHNIIGTSDDPFVLDFSPLEPVISFDGNVEIMIRDTTWTGEQKFTFKAMDCQYPQYFYDESEVSYCVVADSIELQPYYYDGDGDGSGNPSIVIYACSQPESGWSPIGLDCNDTDPLSQGFALETNIMESSGIPNDGIVCSGSPATITVDGPIAFLWENGLTTSSILVNPTVTTDYRVTVTSSEGCMAEASIQVIVEGTVVTATTDSGRGSLRSVLECLVDGGSIYYDQPLTNETVLTNTLNITKNVTIQGLSSNLRPTIGIDFEMLINGINILSGKTLNLYHVDLRVLNHTDSKPFFDGSGQVRISGNTKITE
jgi:hypothetical protein